MGNDIEQIAPTPWKPREAYDIEDANGDLICGCMGLKNKITPFRDHIIACVNACEKLNPDAVPELLAVCEAVDDCLGESWNTDIAWATAAKALARRVRAALENAKVPDA